jgi:hypothetical protein
MSGNITQFRKTADPRSALRIARITTLLGELEALSYARNVPLPLLVHTRESIERARVVLTSCARFANRLAATEGDESEPQPEVDRDVLERMYRNLGAGRRPCDSSR